MTLTQFKKTYKRMLKSVNERILKDGERLFKSGGIDPAGSGKNDGRIPMTILHAAMTNNELTLPAEWLKDSKNLQHF